MEFSYITRPYKIAKADRKFKGIVAANLAELKEKAVKSLDLDVDSHSEIDAFLEEDDTLVDDQDYFATIPENTKLILKTKTNEGKDAVDGPKYEVSESQEFSNRICEIPEDLAKKIIVLGPTQCIMSIMGMSNDELEMLSNFPLNVFVDELGFSEDLARVFLDSATKELVRRNELDNATQLLKLYDRAKGNMDKIDSGKRKKSKV